MSKHIYFREFCDYDRDIIIFGCGENGKTIYKYLQKTNVGRVICFVDNKKSKLKYYKRTKIIRPESAKKLFKNPLWIISSPSNSEQMLHQLINLKIKESDIIQPTEEDISHMYKYIHTWWLEEDKYFMYCYGFPININLVIDQFWNFFANRYYEFIMNQKISVKKNEKQYKYNVSICAIFLNESFYIKEWIEFHRIVGIEHFYLYNNMSTDRYIDILKPYIEKGIVTLIDWSIPHGQISAYKDCIKRFSNETRWIGFIDLDEFVVPREKKIYDFLEQYNYKCGSILIYTKIYGSSGIKNRDLNGLVTEDFKKCWYKLADIGKCFYNTLFQLSDESKNGLAFYHICWTKRKSIDIPPMNVFGKVSQTWGIQRAKNIEAPVQINHYLTKSYQEFQKKIIQPDATFKNNIRREYHFYLYDDRAIATDSVIEKYIPLLKKRLKKLDDSG